MRRAIVIAAVLATAALAGTAALGHDQPTLRLDPASVSAGGSITCLGSDMSVASRWTLTLERAGKTLTLRDSIVATGDDEGAFTVKIVIPADTAPGSYRIRASSAEGISATADLTVTPAGTTMNAPAAMMMPSAAEHDLDRGKPASEVVALWAVALAAAAVGTMLVLARERSKPAVP